MEFVTYILMEYVTYILILIIMYIVWNDRNNRPKH